MLVGVLEHRMFEKLIRASEFQMSIRNKTQAKRMLKSRLLEAQKYRCANCQHEIYITDSDKDPYEAALVRLDQFLPRTYSNTIAMCQKCGGYVSQQFANLWAMVNSNIVIPKKEKIRASYPETIQLINARLEKEKLEFLKLDMTSKYRFTPPNVHERIALAIANAYERERMKKAKVGESVEKEIRLTSKNRMLLINFLSGCQNHRCCYCHRKFSNGWNSFTNPTIEHVQDQSLGGTDYISNLVAACSTCNNLRGIHKMSAEKFYDWIQTNPNKITEMEMKILWRQHHKKKTKKKLIAV